MSPQDYVGSYRLINLIRAGKTCEVWDAANDAKGERVAIKLLSGEAARSREEVGFLKHEYQVARGLDHPSVIKVYGFGRARGSYYLMMELFQAPNLKQLIQQDFDSLIWDRPRTARIFGFTHRLEAYVPKDKRVHGYFAMPVLAGGRLVGRVDPARSGTTLIARQVSLEPGPGRRFALSAMAGALWSAAEWVGCDEVRVERGGTPDLVHELRAALSTGR